MNTLPEKTAHWEIVPAQPEHIPAIAGNMRAIDRREVWASSRKTPREALEHSLGASVMAWTCCVQGTPAFMWGVGRVGGFLSETGSPWLLGTDDLTRIGPAFVRHSRAFVDAMLEPFTRLENIVHAENHVSIRWLVWCGFIIDCDMVQRNGEPFFPFWKE